MDVLPNPRTCEHLVNQARIKAYWIFEPTTKTWFTPEEFFEKYQSCKSGFEDFFAQCQVRDPNDGVSAAMTKVHRLQDQLTGFVNKIVVYYMQH